MRKNKIYDYYDSHAKTCAPDDFWGQVKRSVNGHVVGDDQIQMIVDAISGGLQIAENDTLLDLCCGNGVLTDLVFDRCSGGLGVDFGEYLIGVAKAHFEHLPSRRYLLADVEEFVSSGVDRAQFTKVLCYSSFQYFSPTSAVEILAGIREHFTSVQRVFLGNMPDKARVRDFYYEGTYVPGVEDEHESPIGCWRTQGEFTALSSAAGWDAAFQRMPEEFYAAHYRFDAVLTRRIG